MSEITGTAPSCDKPTDDGRCCKLPDHDGDCFGYDRLAAVLVPRAPDPSPRPDDLAAVRERLRLLVRWATDPDNAEDRATNLRRIGERVVDCPALLADPAPEGLSQEERAHVEPRPADALAAWLVDRWNDDDGYDPSDRVVVAQTIRDFGETRVVWDPQWPGYPEDVLDRLSASPETGEGGDE